MNGELENLQIKVELAHNQDLLMFQHKTDSRIKVSRLVPKKFWVKFFGNFYQTNEEY